VLASTQKTTIFNPNWFCLDLRPYWQVGRLPNSERVVLIDKENTSHYELSGMEGYALQSFTGKFTIARVQARCEQKFGSDCPKDLVIKLLDKLTNLGIIEEIVRDIEERETREESLSDLSYFKSCIEWIEHPDGYWILRNWEDMTYLQLDDCDKVALDDLGKMPLAEISLKYKISLEKLQHLIQLLGATGMLVGTTPPKPPKKEVYSLATSLF
jgi:putative peptide zinc metalloprotease protein